MARGIQPLAGRFGKASVLPRVAHVPTRALAALVCGVIGVAEVREPATELVLFPLSVLPDATMLPALGLAAPRGRPADRAVTVAPIERSPPRRA